MIDLYYWPTPNGHKITIFLEEAQIAYNIKPINLEKNEQFDPSFLSLCPNNKIPALLDHDHQEPVKIFESGAILLYLAEKTKKFGGQNPDEHLRVHQWLMWQMGGLGPMAGQAYHFNNTHLDSPYATQRYTLETQRLYGVLNQQLEKTPYIAGENYTIADMAILPWTKSWKAQGQDLSHLHHLQRWRKKLFERQSVKKAYEIGDKIQAQA